ncbi:MAG: Rrf2 family transcriptional regulator [Lawsonibacter sp.]|nr:Rrf2 family transcriptional regulator [Lawsonibacter sp.]
MMISTKGRYALRVMIELAAREEDGLVSLKEVAEHQQISEKYLEAIMKSLVTDGLVVGLRGKNGGYRLAQPAAKCTVAAILRAAEGSLAPVSCLEGDAVLCPRQGTCATLPMWRELSRLIENFFEGITLEQLAAQASESEKRESDLGERLKKVKRERK